MKPPILTSREKQVLALLKGGLSNKEIGATLNISTHTAKHYVSVLLRKFKFTDRKQFLLSVTINDILKSGKKN